MRLLTGAAAVALAAVLSIGSANADTLGFFSIVSGNPNNATLPTGSTDTTSFNPGGWVNSNNFDLGQGSKVTAFTSFAAGQGLFVSDGLATAPLNVTLTFTYEGFEAGYKNAAFNYNNGTSPPLFVNYTTMIGSNTYSAASVGNQVIESFTLSTDPALVPFLFQSFGGNTIAINGGDVTPGATIAFAVVNGGLTAYAFFDNSGAGPDNDYDDMVVKIEALVSGNSSTTPIPAALPLFASGLGALGLLSWRRKRKNAVAPQPPEQNI